jgi:hypothetical protein
MCAAAVAAAVAVANRQNTDKLISGSLALLARSCRLGGTKI